MNEKGQIIMNIITYIIAHIKNIIGKIATILMTDDDIRELHYSIRVGDPKCVTRLLQRGVDLNTKCPNILSTAAKYNHAEIVTLLLEHKVGIQDNHALRWATRNGDARMVAELLQHGCCDDEALLAAVNKQQLKIVVMLLEHGANVCHYENAALRMSVRKGNAIIVAKLLEYGGDIHARDDEILKYLEENFDEELARTMLPYCDSNDYHYFPDYYILTNVVSIKSATEIKN